MRKTINILLVLSFLAVIGVSCERLVVTARTATPENSRIWQATWLDQPMCKPPCWQNITPGVTTRNEALSILENMSGVIITYNKESGLEWNFGSKAEGGIISLSEDGVVSFIWLGSINEDLYLKKVISIYGLPNYVQPYDCRGAMCSISLIYPNLGMLLSVFTENTGDIDNPQVEIQSNTIINRVYFIQPDVENSKSFFVAPQDNIPTMLWEGYGEYP